MNKEEACAIVNQGDDEVQQFNNHYFDVEQNILGKRYDTKKSILLAEVVADVMPDVKYERLFVTPSEKFFLMLDSGFLMQKTIKVLSDTEAVAWLESYPNIMDYGYSSYFDFQAA